MKRVSYFGGKVKSDKSACIANRKVVLFGGDSVGSATKVGSFTTGETGGWSVESDFTENVYFAKAKPRDIAAGHCKGAQSQALHQTVW